MAPQPETRAERRSQFKRGAAKTLRSDATECERQLWQSLRGKKMERVRFRRQQPVGHYVVDFFCSAAKLVVELDGSQHGTAENIAYDEVRTQWLEARGYRVLRFGNVEFLKNKEAALEGIWRAVKERAMPLPEPPSAVRPSLKGRVE